MGRRNHPHRNKTLYILRGLPGTNKSIRARRLKRMYGGEIINADDYHRTPHGELHIRPERLNDGHNWARNQALQAMDDGVDPVIIDNTNMALWEMFPYVLMGYHRNYWIKFKLTRDTWNVSLDELDRRNQHIPRGVLERMLSRYQSVRHVFDILWDKESRKKFHSSIDRWIPHDQRGV